ncbi:1-acyl-sn-glycerol-3-phosphate acyltransferase [Chitinophaga horti]|uniref:1-acyl-sn-glycerol-3-phosphate acyltransferase n=1 Tax=Chitinophaga horti TaxID=2920382 RepID=A0ABY6IXE4_9BACT|nr:1-acyl-sn-glycerol-3-phosphate acyltransferase [Chitinophaga horti]UYQ92060.1 1-acyl-sn-glycerol-3-phosphate acyltransferase [Chitinophaga horti]
MRGYDFTKLKGPLLLAVNHSGSFLDAMILGALFNRDMYFLARGDAFKKPVARKLLEALHNIPIFRLSEGKENMGQNDETFERCQQIFRKNGIVLIFAEGLCIHEWKLRPLKKGTARMAISAWAEADTADLTILPIGVNYSSFKDFNSSIYINVGDPISAKTVEAAKGMVNPLQVNRVLTESMEAQIFHFPNEDATYAAAYAAMLFNAPATDKDVLHAMGDQLQQTPKERLSFFTTPGHKAIAWNGGQLLFSFLTALVLAIPALAGYLINAPFYYPVRNFARKKTNKTVFYGSVFLGLLMIAYLIYALLLSALSCIWLGVWGLLGIVALPLLGWTVGKFRDAWWRIMNYGKLKAEDRIYLRGLFKK